ncbi:MAG: hypothetical protein GF317_04415 [Candidatus Lokiarchaeota archaeon]|nr:hypothetical protein [Candidatus Lokiarchaeota archaeon]MBD3199133.1 hypothetical protein [Candidatus Lokiarchaeota archaeon]
MTISKTSEITTSGLRTNNPSQDYLLEAKVPKFLGCLISDYDGKTLLIFEFYKGAMEYFIKQNLSKKKRNNFDLELVPMFISAINKYSVELYDKNIIDIHMFGHNIKMKSILHFDKYIITFFLNPATKFEDYQEEVVLFFSTMFRSYYKELEVYNEFCHDPKNIFSEIEKLGNLWIQKLSSDSI